MTQSARDALIDILLHKGITDPLVLAALKDVPREAFVAPPQQRYAYDDNALPIAAEQTISQPFIVALMTSYLLQADRPMNKVLEIGTGSGYQAAVLAQCVLHVYSIERIQSLAETAASTLTRLYPDKMQHGEIQLKYDDGLKGWPDAAPFDGIIVTAASQHVPPALTAQLADKGRLVIPVGKSGAQTLQIITRQGKQLSTQQTEPVRFVPLLPGKQGEPD